MRLALVLLASACFAQVPYRSLTGGYGSVTLPSTAAFNNITATRIEFRYAPSGTSGRITSIGSIIISQGSGVISATSFYGGGDTITLNYSSATEIIVRVSQNSGGFWMDAWTPDGATYYQGQSNSQDLGTVDLRGTDSVVRHNGGGGGGTAGTVAWIRQYTSVLGSALIRTSSPAPTNQGAASSLIYWNFEGNGNDDSGNGANLTMTSATYGSTPVVPQVGEPSTTRSGVAPTLDCSGTYADSYKWRYIGSEPWVQIASSTSATTTATGLNTAGQYLFRCEATINGVSATSDLPVGSVPTNANAVVIPPTSRIGFLTAPMLRGGASPWSYYDLNRPRRSYLVGTSNLAQMATDIDTPLAGTVSISNGSTTLTGSGTAFNSTMANGCILLVYYVNGDGKVSRWRVNVVTVDSDTQITINTPWPKPTQAAVQYQRWGTGDGGDANLRWIDSVNYYDVALGQYITGYKTGQTRFFTIAAQTANYWWLFLDRGSAAGFNAPRIQAYEGIMLAQERGELTNTTAADVYDSAQLYSWSGDGAVSIGFRNYIYDRSTDFGYTNFYFGTRENGYAFRFAVESAYLNPDAGVRSDWTSRLTTSMTKNYIPFQCNSANPAMGDYCRTPDGDFRWIDNCRDPDCMTGPWQGKLAEEPWHTGILSQGLQRYIRWTSNADATTVFTGWVDNLLNTVQPGAEPGTDGLYQLSVASSFPGVNCRTHFYTNTGGTTSALQSGLVQGGSCTGDLVALIGSRDKNNEMVSTYGFAYRLTSSAAYKTRGDDAFGATFGGDDGYPGQWASTLALNQAKTLGQALCCNDSYLVDRLGATDADITPVAATLSVGFTLSGVTNATKIRITAKNPNGETTTTTCTVSPCVASGFDTRQGNKAEMKVQYLSAGDAVLASGDFQPVDLL